MSTVFEMRYSNVKREQLVKRLEVYTNSNWASDQSYAVRSSWPKARHCMFTVVVILQKHGKIVKQT